MTHPHRTAEPAEYNSVVRRTTVRTIRLVASECEIKPEAVGTEPAEWENFIERKVEDVLTDEASGALHGFIDFRVLCRHKRKRVFSTSARYIVSYQVEGGCPADLGRLFIERVGLVAVYPYFRSVVANFASQAGLMMPPLPIISLAPRSLASAATLEEAVGVPSATSAPPRPGKPTRAGRSARSVEKASS